MGKVAEKNDDKDNRINGYTQIDDLAKKSQIHREVTTVNYCKSESNCLVVLTNQRTITGKLIKNKDQQIFFK